MPFRYSWSLFAWGREPCCSNSSLGGVVGDTQKRKREGRILLEILYISRHPFESCSNCEVRHSYILHRCNNHEFVVHVWALQ